MTGCAAYETRQEMAERGTVLITWAVDPSRVPGSHCGWATEISRGHYLVLFKRKYGFEELCWVQEIFHALGATHTQAEGK